MISEQDLFLMACRSGRQDFEIFSVTDSVLHDEDWCNNDVQAAAQQNCLDQTMWHSGFTGELQDVCEAARNSCSFPSFSLENVLESQNAATCEMSTVETIRAAVAKFTSAPGEVEVRFPALPDVFMKVRLVESLISAAKKVEIGLFNDVSAILAHCDQFSCISGDSVQRILFLFSRALCASINRETAPLPDQFGRRLREYLEDSIISYSPPILTHHRKVPFCQIQQFCAVQIIEDHVGTAKTIHVIDLAALCGVQWSVLMQGLAARRECPVKLLKVTVIESLSQGSIEDTRERLKHFARQLKLPFSFRMIMLSDIEILNEDLVNIEEDETVVVSVQFGFRVWFPWPDHLESLMTVIKRINPYIMVLTESNTNLSSLALFERCREALFYFGAYFDSLDECMGWDDRNRIDFETVYLGNAIRTIVGAEEDEKTYQYRKLDEWRAFFGRFRMVEANHSKACLLQAELVKNNFKCARSCTLDMNGKSLVIGWKGEPLHFVSAWKF